MLQLRECEHETAERWVSLLEVFRVYLAVRRKIKIVNPYIGGKCSIISNVYMRSGS